MGGRTQLPATRTYPACSVLNRYTSVLKIETPLSISSTALINLVFKRTVTVFELFPTAAEAWILERPFERRHPFTRKPRLVFAKIGLQTLGQLCESGNGRIIKIAVPAAKIAERLRISIGDEPQFRTIPGAQMKVGTFAAGRVPFAFHGTEAVIKR